MKTEPDVYSIDDLKRDGVTSWTGVRNYQARNFMRDDMKVGDRVLFYHSNAEPPGIAGIAEVCREAHPDTSALDPNGPYYDAKSSVNNPIWMMVDVRFVRKFKRLLCLNELKAENKLDGMLVSKRGMRLSVQPVAPAHFKRIEQMADS